MISVLSNQMGSEDIPMVLVRFVDGDECWVPKREYYANPPHGSFVVIDRRKPAPSNALETL